MQEDTTSSAEVTQTTEPTKATISTEATQSSEPTKTTEDDGFINADYPEIITDDKLVIADFLPAIEFKGTFAKIEMQPFDDSYSNLCAYTSDAYSVVVAKWTEPLEKDASKTILEYAQEEADYWFPEQEIIAKEFNEWEEPGDYEYAYYVGLVEDEEIFGGKMYLQSFIFRHDNDFYEYDYYTPTRELQIPGLDLTMCIPIDYSEEPESALYSSDGEVLCITDKAHEFSSMSVYVANNQGHTVSEVASYYKSYMHASVLEPYTYEAEDGTIYDCLYAEYEDEGYYTQEYITTIGENFVYFSYWQDMKDASWDYEQVSVPALVWGIEI